MDVFGNEIWLCLGKAHTIPSRDVTGGLMKVTRNRRLAVVAISVATVAAVGLTTPAKAATTTINVLMVGNPQMKDLQSLTDANFTPASGIKVNYTILPENELRDKVTTDVASGAGQYDVVTLGMYDIANWAGTGKLKAIDSYVASDSAWNKADVFPSMIKGLSGSDGKLYAAPFYGESSMLMYRKDLAAAAKVKIPLHPTWAQVAAAAKAMTNKAKGISGICLRGLPGWGEQFAPLTTVVNTFGGTWFDAKWNAQVNSAAFNKAVSFYVNLLKTSGEAGATQAGFTECDNAMAQGKTAMWYDATSATGSIEKKGFSNYVGKFGYAYAPTATPGEKASGWLWAWAFAIEGASKQADAAWKFISWATSSKYENLVGAKLGWTAVPDGKRASTYANANYRKAAAAYYRVVLGSLKAANPLNPGSQPRPTSGIQFVAIPEFADLGTAVSQEVAKAITGGQTVAQALDKGQKLAEVVAALHKK
jgi:sorbitol/mannitol transport system substrate-binding protein